MCVNFFNPLSGFLKFFRTAENFKQILRTYFNAPDYDHFRVLSVCRRAGVCQNWGKCRNHYYLLIAWLAMY